MKKRVTVKALTIDAEWKRVSIPAEFADEPTAGHRSVGTGLVRIGTYIGRKYAVVQNYSKWLMDDGRVKGRYFLVLPLSAVDREIHYTDWTNL